MIINKFWFDFLPTLKGGIYFVSLTNNLFKEVDSWQSTSFVLYGLTLIDAKKMYSNKYGLLSELALALTLKNNNETKSTLINEAISLSERILENSTNEKLRSTTAANLCFLYLKANEYEKAENLVSTLPHIWECREMLLPELFVDSEYADELKKAVIKMLMVICKKIYNSENHKFSNPDNTIAMGIDFNLECDIKEKMQLLTKFLDVAP